MLPSWEYTAYSVLLCATTSAWPRIRDGPNRDAQGGATITLTRISETRTSRSAKFGDRGGHEGRCVTVMCISSKSISNNGVTHSYRYRKYVCSHDYSPHTCPLMSTCESNFQDCGKHGLFAEKLRPKDKDVHSFLFLRTARTYELGFVKNLFFYSQWPKQKLRITVYKNQFIS
jgi:hypothetical protein